MRQINALLTYQSIALNAIVAKEGEFGFVSLNKRADNAEPRKSFYLFVKIERKSSICPQTAQTKDSDSDSEKYDVCPPSKTYASLSYNKFRRIKSTKFNLLIKKLIYPVGI